MLNRICTLGIVIATLLFTSQSGHNTTAKETFYEGPQAYYVLDSPIIKTNLLDSFKEKKSVFSRELRKSKKITNSVVKQQSLIVKQTNTVDALVNKLSKDTITDTLIIVNTEDTPIRDTLVVKKGFFRKLFWFIK